MNLNGSFLRLSATQPIAYRRIWVMLKTSLYGPTSWLLTVLLIAAMLPLSITAQNREPDPRTAGSDIVGKLMPVRDPTGMVRIPSKYKKIMEDNLQQFVSIVLRNPALRPPVGFNFKTGTHAYAPPLPVSQNAPLAYTMTVLFYWYTYMPGYGKIRPLDVAMHAFYVRANDISTVFDKLERWQLDEQGLTYLEPWEIRKVSGFPLYSSGFVVLKNNPRPIWVPVTREWALQHELAQRRKNLDSIIKSDKDAEAYDPIAILEKWLGDRSERQREMEKNYAEMKKNNPEYAEKIRSNFFDNEKSVEKALRYTVEHEKGSTSHYKESLVKERTGEEKCIRYLEDKLAHLSPAERVAPAYISLSIYNLKKSSPETDCSCIVDANFPDARRLVTENPEYYNKSLPPSAIQVILVDFSNFKRAVMTYPPWRYAAYERIRDGLDYSALAAMLQE